MTDKIVILGFLSHFPVAGVAWQTLHYLVGFERLGFDVYYVEAHGCTASKLMQSPSDDGPARAADHIHRILEPFGFGRKWAYHAPYPESRHFGLSETRLNELYRSAALIINLHGSHLPTPELTSTNRLVYLETDPVDIQIDLFNGRKETVEYLSPHCAFFTYGESLGRPDCLLPVSERFTFRPTRQPVVLDFWTNQTTARPEAFTTIGNWQQPWREVKFKGEVYRWSKHFEFLKVIDLPQRVKQPFELALSSYRDEDRELLQSKGWRVRDALALSEDLETYRQYICQSRGEFTVAKDQNIRLRSGWFSDRAITYLAAGRPVITQETGFSNNLPVGEGLFAFSTMDELVAAVESVNRDYEQHSRAALKIARECFSYDVVLGRMLDDLGVSRPHRPHGTPSPLAKSPVGPVCPIPPSLVLAPIGRWPTRLPEKTIQTALSLAPFPQKEGTNPADPLGSQVAVDTKAQPSSLPSANEPTIGGPSARASIVMVLHNGLAYTKLCLTALLSDWRPGDELILVDNNSSDGSLAYLRQLQALNPFLRVISNSVNRGFAVANNQGLMEASGDVFILLNNDTITPPGWRDRLLRCLHDPTVGLAGPVTNRTCNEAQIDAPYRTYNEMVQFAATRAQVHDRQSTELSMLAMFCLAFRRDVFQRVGLLDEQFGLGMFEDDDFSLRVRRSGYKIICAEDVFVHHFGQGSFGELCSTGKYDTIFEGNRRRFEEKWGITWQPHGRRITAEYQELRERIKQNVSRHLPKGASVAIISKGDEELLKLTSQSAWHFPQAKDGSYPSIYPADSAEAIAHLEALRGKGANFLLIPKPAFWWLDHYREFKGHLDQRYRVALRDLDTCVVFDLGGSHG